MSSDTATTPRTDLLERSIQLLRDSQEPTGAWLACQDFPNYRYCWIRDGVFIAHALDLTGHHDHAAAFHDWTARTVLSHAGKIDQLQRARPDLAPDEPLGADLALHPRFTAVGDEVDDDWGNFQLDGYGLWLTGLAHHLAATGARPDPYRDATEAVVRYLTLTWDLPGYDSWEEYPYNRHPTTLAAVARGLAAATEMLVSPDGQLPQRIIDLIRHRGTHQGALTKLLRDDPVRHPTTGAETFPPDVAAVAGHERPGRRLPNDAVDASALLVLGDFGPFEHNPRVVDATLARISTDLLVNGGVHRYQHDEYYGGGLWVVLAGALAGIQIRRGRPDAHRRTLAWVEAQADADGQLPEQTGEALRYPELQGPWTDRWGPVASPLLWSHAMYIIARVVPRLGS